MNGLLALQALLLACCWAISARRLLRFALRVTPDSQGSSDQTAATSRLTQLIAAQLYVAPLAFQMALAGWLSYQQFQQSNQPRFGQKVVGATVAGEVGVERRNLQRLPWWQIVNSDQSQTSIYLRKFHQITGREFSVTTPLDAMTLCPASKIVGGRHDGPDRHQDTCNPDERRHLGDNATKGCGSGEQREGRDRTVDTCEKDLVHLLEQHVVADVQLRLVNSPFVVCVRHPTTPCDAAAEAEAAGCAPEAHSWARASGYPLEDYAAAQNAVGVLWPWLPSSVRSAYAVTSKRDHYTVAAKGVEEGVLL